MKKIAFVICTKESNHIYNCVDSIKKHYEDSADIIIVDSCSTDKRYFELKEKYSNVLIEDICNKNYEYGAIMHGFNKYQEYDVYIFIQDAVSITKKIKEISTINNDEMYVLGNYEVSSGWSADPRSKEIFYAKSPEFPKFDFEKDKFIIAQWNCFIVDRQTFKKIIESELFFKAHPADEKIMSQAWERIWSIIFQKNKIDVKIVDQTQYTKTFGKRT